MDPRRVPGRVQLIHRRRENKVDARRGRDARVVRLIARVFGQVLGVAELARVDEDAGDHNVGCAPRRVEQGHMAGVQRPHGRDKSDSRTAA